MLKGSLGPRIRGAALIEVLVSMLLSAVALLALATVNATALRWSKLSQHRASATLLALDLAERLRANPAGVVDGHYQFVADWASQSAVAPPTAQCQRAGSVCDPAGMAALDMSHWRWHVRQQMPRGSVHVQSQPGTGVRQAAQYVDLWIAWQEPVSTPSAVAGAGTTVPGESPKAQAECPGALGTASDPSVRCSHLRVHL